ncbi:hypothetical protein D3C77_515990 [compost metagenome]
MGLGLIPFQGGRAPQQQAIVRRALDQAEEVLRRTQRVVDAQQPALMRPAQQRFHPCQHALGPGFVEVLAKTRVQAALGHDQTAEFDRFITADQRLETTGNGQQHFFHRCPFRVLEQQVGQLDLTSGHDRRAEQGLLVGEVAVHGEL